MNMRNHIILIITCIILILSAVLGYAIITSIGTTGSENDKGIVVVSPHPVEFMKPLINEFETETGIAVRIIQCGTSKALSMIEDGEKVDVLWGGSVTSVGSYGNLFLSYRTDNYDSFAEEFKDAGDEFTCFTDVPSVIMINTDLVSEDQIRGYEDLLKPEFRGKIAFADPARSSSSFEQLTNMLYAMGGGDPEKGWVYVEGFADQLDGKLLESSSEVYQGVASGKFKVGLTFEEAAITMLKSGAHVKIVYMKEGVVSTPDGIYICKDAQNVDGAKSFVDFMTSFDAQQVISKDLGRRSVRSDVESSKLVTAKENINIIDVDRNLVVSSSKKWIARFAELYGEDTNE